MSVCQFGPYSRPKYDYESTDPGRIMLVEGFPQSFFLKRDEHTVNHSFVTSLRIMVFVKDRAHKHLPSPSCNLSFNNEYPVIVTMVDIVLCLRLCLCLY